MAKYSTEFREASLKRVQDILDGGAESTQAALRAAAAETGASVETLRLWRQAQVHLEPNHADEPRQGERQVPSLSSETLLRGILMALMEALTPE